VTNYGVIHNGWRDRVQELLVPRCKKSGKEGKRPAWLSRHLLFRLKGKRELHRQ